MSSRSKRKSKSGKGNSGQSNSQKKPSPTTQILEHVELLIALHEERDAAEVSSQGLDVGDLASSVAEKLEPEILKRLDAIESKLSSIEVAAQTSDGHESFENSEERFEAFDTRLNKIAEAITGQQQLIEAQGVAGAVDADASIMDSFQAQFSELVDQMKQELAAVSRASANIMADATQDGDFEGNTNSPSEHDWGSQKEAMLSKYGIDPEHRPDMAPPTEPDPVMETTMADQTLSEELSASVNLDADKENSADSEEIQRIKKDFNAQLRDAEVKLSIERAKLSQLQSELESKEVELKSQQVELDRRDSALSRKYKGSKNSTSEQFSLLARLKEHLTAKDRKNLDRI